MITAKSTSQLIRDVFAKLSPLCREFGKRHGVIVRLSASTAQQNALEGLFDSPSSFLVVIVPGDETVLSSEAGGDMVAELQMASSQLVVFVSHKLPPTATPAQGLYEQVGKMPPLLDLVDSVRDAIRTMEIEKGSTSILWKYLGRKYLAIDGGTRVHPCYQLTFELTVTMPYFGGSPEIVSNLPSPEDLEELEDTPPPDVAEEFLEEQENQETQEIINKE